MTVSTVHVMEWLYLKNLKLSNYWLYFHELNQNDTFTGFKIPSHLIFLHNLYRKSLFHEYWNSPIGPSTNTMKIGTPWKSIHSTSNEYFNQDSVINFNINIFILQEYFFCLIMYVYMSTYHLTYLSEHQFFCMSEPWPFALGCPWPPTADAVNQLL